MAEDFQKILDDLEKEAQYQKMEIISREKGVFLGELVEKFKPKNILEIGAGIGYSGLFLASDLPAEGKIWACDANFSYLQIARKTFERVDLADKIEFVMGDVFETFPKLEAKFDLVFLDAARDEYFRYLHLIEDKLASKAVIVANGVGIYEEEMKNYLDEVRNSGKFDSHYRAFGEDGMEVSIKKS